MKSNLQFKSEKLALLDNPLAPYSLCPIPVPSCDLKVMQFVTSFSIKIYIEIGIIVSVNHEQVEFLVKIAEEYDVVIVPYGGGTSVTNALMLPESETRMIASLDTSQMVCYAFHRDFIFI